MVEDVPASPAIVEQVAVVNETFAARLSPGEPAVGKVILRGINAEPTEIVGVVGTGDKDVVVVATDDVRIVGPPTSPGPVTGRSGACWRCCSRCRAIRSPAIG